jgi:hypothetical protein
MVPVTHDENGHYRFKDSCTYPLWPVPNQSLQGTFDPSPIFAAAKTVAASNAPELRR